MLINDAIFAQLNIYKLYKLIQNLKKKISKEKDLHDEYLKKQKQILYICEHTIVAFLHI